MDYKILFISIIFILYSKLQGAFAVLNVTDEEYSIMPPVFHLDDFDNCMYKGKNAFYCAVTIQLTPTDYRDYSEMWRVIKKVSSYPKSYRHDKLRYGICVAQSCPKLTTNLSIYMQDERLLNKALSECFSEKYEEFNITAVVTDMHCETNEPFYPVDGYDIAVGLFILILIATVVFASCYEGTARYKTPEEYNAITNTRFGRVISCFSIPKNWKKLATQSNNPDTVSLKCINGIRFYNMILVVMVHVGMIAQGGAITNTRFTENLTNEPGNMIIMNGAFVIQSFLLITGWIMSYNMFLMHERKKNISVGYVIQSFIYRYIRITPVVLVMVSINATWFYHLNRGPMWDKFVGAQYRNCRANWWTNLLYINNYVDPEHMCLQETWYLAADTQLFIIALLITVLMVKNQKYVKSILATSLIIAVAAPGVVNFIYDYDVVIRHYPEPLYEFLLNVPQWHKLFSSGYANMGGSILGLIFGYVYYTYRGQKLFTKKIHVVLWWLIFWGFTMTVIYVGIPIYSDDYEHNRFLAALNQSLARNFFGLAIGVGILGVTQGIGWFMRDLLLWSPVHVLGKLTYCAYLVHVTLMRAQGGILRTPQFMSHYLVLHSTVGHLALAYIFATILCMFVEMPVAGLQKLMSTPQRKKDETIKDFTKEQNLMDKNTIDSSKV